MSAVPQVPRRPRARRSDGRALARCVARSRRRSRPRGASAPARRGEQLPRSFDDLLDLDGVDELLSRRGLRTPFLRMAKDGVVVDAARFTRPGGVGAAIGDQVDDTAVTRLFADGTTIVLQALHRLWPPIIEFAGALTARARAPDPGQRVRHASGVARVRRALRHPRRVRPPARRREALDRPRAGARVAAPVTAVDAAPRIDVAQAVAESAPTIDTVLRPGDALYLRAGSCTLRRRSGMSPRT